MILAILIGFKFLQKKSESMKIILFLLLWIVLFYFPSWFTQNHYVKEGVISSVSNRYFAIPSIGFIGLIGYLISHIKPKYRNISLLLVIGLNIWSSERGLIVSSTYRSQTQQNNLYQSIDQDLPMGEEKSDLLLFLGYDWFKIIELDWNGFYPLAVKRNIQKKENFATIVSTVEEAKGMLCSNPPKFRLSKFYAWGFQNNQLYNITDQVKQIISKDENAFCYLNNSLNAGSRVKILNTFFRVDYTSTKLCNKWG